MHPKNIVFAMMIYHPIFIMHYVLRLRRTHHLLPSVCCRARHALQTIAIVQCVKSYLTARRRHHTHHHCHSHAIESFCYALKALANQHLSEQLTTPLPLAQCRANTERTTKGNRSSFISYAHDSSNATLLTSPHLLPAVRVHEQHHSQLHTHLQALFHSL
jgi:hypothetical protein